MQRTVVVVSKLAPSSAADPRPHYAMRELTKKNFKPCESTALDPAIV